MEAKTWKTRRPARVVVSISSGRERKPAPHSLDRPDDLQQIAQGTGEPVVVGDDDDISLTQMLKQFVEFGPFAHRPADLVREDAFAPCGA
jgi:hypothetical protein